MPAEGPDTWERFLQYLEGYDAGIAYVDEKVGDLLDELERLGVREETTVIVSADHGESVGELGMYFEHGNATEGTTRVPLIVQWPGGARGQTLDGLWYQLDLSPTVIDRLGLPVPAGWDGRSFARALDGDRSTPARDHLVVGSGIYSFQRAVRTERYRLIRTIHSGCYPYERDPFQEQLRAGVDPDLYCPLQRMQEQLREGGRNDQLDDLERRRGATPALRPW
jgi:arylsulfatase A-like enzyme